MCQLLVSLLSTVVVFEVRHTSPGSPEREKTRKSYCLNIANKSEWTDL